MRHMEFSGAARALAPMLAVTLGGAMLIGGHVEAHVNQAAVQPSVVAVAARTAVDSMVTGRIETLAGEPVAAMDGPFGTAVGEYEDGSQVQIICQAPGVSAPGNPADFGKPPLADTTWYRLGDPTSGRPFAPERWIPQNPVFTDDPVPSCPPR